MRKFFLVQFYVVSLGVSLLGCQSDVDTDDIWNSIDNLENRVTSLEKVCNQINGNITSLQALVQAVQDNVSITSVSPLMEKGKEIGYTITFSKGNPITIYHGGKGDDGKDGITPVVGVSKDEDGVYYWTLNGEWLADADGNKVKAVGTDGMDGKDGINGTNGTDGADGKDGVNGTNGTDGADGKDGKDGVTPNLKIENGNWMLSVDNGTTWTDLGAAKGVDGTDGADGQDGATFFSSIDHTSNTNWVVFTLADGETTIKLPTWSAYEALQTLCNQMNANITALQTAVTALENGETITKITELKDSENNVIGYTLTFKNAGDVNIYHGEDGEDGEDGVDGANGINGTKGDTPVISVAKDSDGIYYWTLNGEWLTDADDKKIKAQGVDGQDGTNGSDGDNGVTPKLKIEGDKWYVSYDNGESWTEAGSAVNGDAVFFTSVTVDDDYVYLQLNSSAETIKIPRYKKLSIAFSETSDIRILGGQSYSITYTLTGATDETLVKALAQDGFKVVVEKGVNNTGTIKIAAPNPMVDSEVLVFVSDGEERTIMRSINFVKGIINITTQAYTVPSDGGIVGVSLSTNINYSVNIPEVDQSWISVAPDAKAAMRDEILKFQIEANDAGARTSVIELVDSEGEVTETIQISQASGNSINVATAGTLKNLIPANEMYSISSLKLTGNLNGDDIAFIREMAGRDVDGNVTEGKLVNIDMQNVTIESGGQPYYKYNYTGNNYIGDYFLYQCSNVKSIKLPQGLTEIGAWAFAECTSLETVTIPESVTFIGRRAFYECISLSDVVFPLNLTQIGESAFYGCTAIKSITLPPSLLLDEMRDFYIFAGCTGLANLNISSGVKVLSQCMFRECSALKQVVIPSSVTTIGSLAFYKAPLEYVYVLSTIPPTLSGQTAFLDVLSSCILYIPKGCKAAYESSDWAYYFTNIVEMED